MKTKRTAKILVRGQMTEYGQEWYEIEKTATCEVTGEMSTGTKVWTEVETGEQYFLTRLDGHYNFFQV